MQTRSILLALLMAITLSAIAKAQAIQTLHEIGSSPFATTNVARNIEHQYYAEWLTPNLPSALTDVKVHESIHRSTLQSGTSVSTEPWEEEWSVPLPFGASAAEVLKSIDDIWAAEGNWTNVSRSDNSDISVWELIDKTGTHWITTARAESSLTKNRCVCSIIITLRAVGSTTSNPVLATRKKL